MDSIDEENRKLLASLDQKRSSSPSVRTRFSPTSTTSPQSPYARNTLGVDSPTPRHGSIAGIGVGVTSPTQPRKKRLDPSDPSTWTSRVTTSPTETRPRAASESQSTGVGVPIIQFDPPSEATKGSTNTASVTQAQFPTPASTQRKGSGSLAAALSGDLDSLHIGARQPTAGQPVSIYESPQTTRPPALSPAGSGNEANEQADRRRFSNQSASFSTMTDDSDRIGAITGGDDKNGEDAVQESTDEERSESDQDEGSPVSERGRKRKSNRESSSPDTSRDAESDKTLLTPQIKSQWQSMLIVSNANPVFS